MRKLGSRGVRSAVAAAVLTGFVPLTTAGCFGNFSLTRKVYQYNQDVDNDRWVQWLVFLVLNVVPVYGFATLFDAVFANSIEFWTGENPVTSAVERERVVYGKNGEVAHTTLRGPGVLDVEIIEANGRRHELTLVREEATVAAYDRDGRFLARVGERGGVPAVIAKAAR